MRPVRTLALKTQYALIVALLVTFALGASVSYWARSRSQTALVVSLNEDVAVATKLPKLKAELRQLDLVTTQYLMTGRPGWLAEREKARQELRRTEQDLARLLRDDREHALLGELDRQLAQYFLDQNRWIELKRSGKLAPEQASKIAASAAAYQGILEIVLNMHDVKLQDIPRLLTDSERAALEGFFLVLLAGLIASGALAVALSRYIIKPISTLAGYAADWQPGQTWDCAAPAVSPEINALFSRVKDLVERLNAEYKKEKNTNRLKSQFVSLVSHELNNALSVIDAASTHLAESDPDPSDVKRKNMHRMIKRQTRALSTAIKNLLNAGRLESGKVALRRNKMDIGKVLKSSVDLLEILYQEKGLKVTLTLPEEPVFVYADPDALTLVATNLLSNAIKYTPPGGSIGLGLARERGERSFVRVYFKDSGIGVRPEEHERIFSGFYRSESGERASSGFGIGLSLAKAIIAAHGGTLELESQPGKGSNFSFLLPLSSAEREDQGPADDAVSKFERRPAPARDGKARKILIVDDDSDVRRALRSILEETGTVLEAPNGPEALNILRTEGPHLMLLDVDMPGMGGLSVLKAAREIEPGLNVLMITGQEDIDLAKRTLDDGARAYITKPFDAQGLRKEVERLLDPLSLEVGPDGKPWRVAGA